MRMLLGFLLLLVLLALLACGSPIAPGVPLDVRPWRTGGALL